ncbi:MAG TPA: hypothetical protein VKX41_06845 [Alloacidobacterium sp.]|jgi:hypothetical protein|nr:hypothetical protein [Alloacidobacterium sp.]
MLEKPEQLNVSPEGDKEENTTRRELIEKYAKYAIATAPLLLFVSKAQAIHSKP